MKRFLFLFGLVVLCYGCFAQKSISVGAGYGIDYGGLGCRISVALTNTNNVAIVGGLGNYFGPPLSIGSIIKSDNTPSIKFTGTNLTGFGYSAGVEYAYYSEWARGGVHYIGTGKFNEEKSLQGINWCLFGGNYYFENIPLFIHYSANWTFLFYKDNLGMMIGASVGIGYSFDLSHSKKKVETRHLRNL
ncbi:MAG: hypothetical protein LBJ63_11105 [Prevotellaceae bacterium]|jgi:hypothetical protein|nr:hypothetical protein [Prevotellaceae bacterium]